MREKGSESLRIKVCESDLEENTNLAVDFFLSVFQTVVEASPFLSH